MTSAIWNQKKMVSVVSSLMAEFFVVFQNFFSSHHQRGLCWSFTFWFVPISIAPNYMNWKKTEKRQRTSKGPPKDLQRTIKGPPKDLQRTSLPTYFFIKWQTKAFSIWSIVIQSVCFCSCGGSISLFTKERVTSITKLEKTEQKHTSFVRLENKSYNIERHFEHLIKEEDEGLRDLFQALHPLL